MDASSVSCRTAAVMLGGGFLCSSQPVRISSDTFRFDASGTGEDTDREHRKRLPELPHERDVVGNWSNRDEGTASSTRGASQLATETSSTRGASFLRRLLPLSRRSGSIRRNCICLCLTCLRKSRTPARGSRFVLSSSLFGCPSYAPLRRLRVCLCRRVARHVIRPVHGLPRLCAFDLRGLHLLWRTGLDDAATA